MASKMSMAAVVAGLGLIVGGTLLGDPAPRVTATAGASGGERAISRPVTADQPDTIPAF